MSIASTVLEWDDVSLEKRNWGPGDWLNEPDKMQFVYMGHPCIILRAQHGALCGYVGIYKSHPCYGLSYNGYSQLIDDIMHEQHRESMKEWASRGYPKTENGLPDMYSHGCGWPEEPKLTAVGEALINIEVHGGLTYSNNPRVPTEEIWQEVQSQFAHARERAKLYPRGDAAIWLRRWEPVENDYEKFKEICRATCICLEPPDDEVWLFGFDCAHSGDVMPA